MFCCGELSPQLIQKQFDPAFWQPSEHDAVLVKATWSDSEDDLSDLGASIYTYIFKNYPEVKNFFPKIHQHGAKWKESKEFHMQGFIFAQVSNKWKIIFFTVSSMRDAGTQARRDDFVSEGPFYKRPSPYVF
jgi:hypothetical protein